MRLLKYSRSRLLSHRLLESAAYCHCMGKNGIFLIYFILVIVNAASLIVNFHFFFNLKINVDCIVYLG